MTLGSITYTSHGYVRKTTFSIGKDKVLQREIVCQGQTVSQPIKVADAKFMLDNYAKTYAKCCSGDDPAKLMKKLMDQKPQDPKVEVAAAAAASAEAAACY